MANPDHLERLKQGKQGVDAWNAWRRQEPSVRPELDGVDFSGANFRGVDFTWADLREADLSGADLTWADLFEASLVAAELARANLAGALLQRADLNRANLIEADLVEAELPLANLVDARFDGANLTGAHLWETQRDGWSIKGVICQHAFWDRDRREPTEYKEGEFERIFAEKPRIILRYPGGMEPRELLALPLVVERLQAEHPGCALQIRSVQSDVGGASVTITVEDLEDRGTEVFKSQLVQIQTKLEAKLEAALEERDYLRQLIEDALTKPRQEIHYHRPRGRIEAPTMSRDTYNVPGQAGYVGPGGHAHDMIFQQIQGGIDLPKLAEELGRLREAMKGEATATREQDKAIGAVTDAEEAAARGDGPAALRYLKSAGTWTLKVAEEFGAAVTVEALKKAMM
jgi:Pentapeptide repeats (8 copies)